MQAVSCPNDIITTQAPARQQFLKLSVLKRIKK